MDKLPSNAYSVHTQSIRNLEVTIQVLNEKKEVIGTIAGKATGGSLAVSGESLIRRTGKLTLVVEDDLFPQPGSLMWFNNTIKIYIGIKDLSQVDQTVNFLLGTFYVGEGGYSLDENNNEITIDLSDKMLAFDEAQLEQPLKLEPETPIGVAIRALMEHIGETEFGEFDKTPENEVVPYTLEYKIGDDILDVIKDLRDMYMDYICGYNIRGEFEFKKVEIQREEDLAPTKWVFDAEGDARLKTMLSFSENYSLKDVKNRVVVYGEVSEKTGLAPYAEVRITDPKSPFNVYSIKPRTAVFSEDKLVTNDQCAAKARFEVLRSSHFQEQCTVTCLPIYFIDASDVIEVVHPVTKLATKYMVDSFSFDFDPGAVMSIQAHKLYYTSVEYGEEKNPLVDGILRGINNWGWLSLAEERIYDCFNIMGSGENTLTIRFQDNLPGGEQASVTAYPSTANQTLLIDLADFENLDLKNENGDSERSKGDYADRVLGHEMVHAVMNDYFGYDKITQMPTWFKEGFAEFLHGAKERYESTYRGLSKAQKKVELVTLSKKLLADEFEGTSEEYVGSYLLTVACYRLAVKNNLWKNLLINLKTQLNPGINFLMKLLPISADIEEVKNQVIKEIEMMDDVWAFLNNVDDLDTGSVGGIHFMNLFGIPLTAESVFNNAQATGDPSKGFKTKVVR